MSSAMRAGEHALLPAAGADDEAAEDVRLNPFPFGDLRSALLQCQAVLSLTELCCLYLFGFP